VLAVAVGEAAAGRGVEGGRVRQEASKAIVCLCMCQQWIRKQR
jgi:hypothetical protein